MDKARTTQIDSFNRSMQSIVEHDNFVSHMPSIRINANKSIRAASVKLQMQENQRKGIKSVPANRYTNRSVEPNNN
jgi:hypothetical protein